MDRRAFLHGLTLWALSAPLAAEAQRLEKVYRIGMLETIPVALNAANLEAFRQGLRELGYIDGQNLVIEYRSADAHAERFPELAAELVRLRVDLIVTRGTPAVLAAKKATGTIPVVMAAIAEPLGHGIVASLARPEGNVTGLSAYVTELGPKRVELLREIIPGLARIAVMVDRGNPASLSTLKKIETAGQSFNIQVQRLDVRTPEDLGSAFDAAARRRVDALVVGLPAVMQANRQRIVQLAARHRLPTIYPSREFVDGGGLITYGVSYPDLYRRAASYVDKILKGANPGELPVEQPTKFELVINLKTAKALGLTIPPALLLRADQVIE